MEWKQTVKYKKGDVYLCSRYGESGPLQEVEVIDISKTAIAVKTDVDGWIDAAKFHATVRGKIGTAKYSGWWIAKRRMVIRE